MSVSTALSAAITAADTMIPLTSVANFPSMQATPGPLASVRIDSEVITYTGISGNDLTGVRRGVSDSTAAAHAGGTTAVLQGVQGTQNDITYDPMAPIPATGGTCQLTGECCTGNADCTDAGDICVPPNEPLPACCPNPTIMKRASSLAFQPAGCFGAACTHIRALVLSTSNIAEIPSGSTLYRCNVSIPSGAAVGETFKLACSGAGSDDPTGLPLSTGCTDGAIVVEVSPTPTVTTPTPVPTRTPRPSMTAARTATVTPTPTATSRVARIAVGSAIGAPDSLVDVTVSLATAGLSVAATGNDIEFDGTALALAATACQVNRSLGKELVTTPLGQGEQGGTTRFRFFVQSTANTAVIPDGPLYTCQFHIQRATFPGRYALHNENVLAFSPAGTAVPLIDGTDGSITVSLVPGACGGDCNGDGMVTINELILGVDIGLGEADVASCPALDVNDDLTVSIDELIRAVSDALSGCAS